ncbi:membrane protein [Staphylococcus microti]|uniref:ABC-2 transporter family protein n=1 Tax=Staphylococcus microti TaxID=569857 RepID=A0A0D6XNY6_9STAP|nr:ABC transporter permease subunit [Staphylococcus microti]KIX90494.1 membrane protein [Staphylococcus microti]PNZ83400.1 ABC transporter permease [Staphylococcus microti]SUM57957.1 ABC-2 transporter family protein [Staphylococcus microti]
MNPLQLVKFDILSILKSPLTYIAILLGALPVTVVVGIVVANGDEVDPNMIVTFEKWFFSIIGLLFVVKTLTRDSSQGTIQLYLNNQRNRINYLITKTCSILFVSVFITGVVLLVAYVVQWTTKGGNLEGKTPWLLLIFYVMLFLIYGLLLFMINLVVQKAAFVYTLGMFLLLFIPMVSPFVPLIPQIGPKIMEALNYIPIGYLTQKTLGDDFTFTTSQWLINAGSMIVLLAGNALLITKKDI